MIEPISETKIAVRYTRVLVDANGWENRMTPFPRYTV